MGSGVINVITAEFILEITGFGERAGFEWSFFTLTRRLQLLVNRLGLAVTYLGEANRKRIAGSERWGTYYACQPKVYAVPGRRLTKEEADRAQNGGRHAAVI